MSKAKGPIMTQIRTTFHSHFNPVKETEDAPKRGRPENKKECSSIVLDVLLEKWEEDLMKKMQREQRIDALFASVSRFFK